VIKVQTDLDCKVWLADVEYKIPRESKFRTTTRPIHKLVVIIPVEEQTFKEDHETTESEDYGRALSPSPGTILGREEKQAQGILKSRPLHAKPLSRSLKKCLSEAPLEVLHEAVNAGTKEQKRPQRPSQDGHVEAGQATQQLWIQTRGVCPTEYW
jgi:hypothetical protein